MVRLELKKVLDKGGDSVILLDADKETSMEIEGYHECTSPGCRILIKKFKKYCTVCEEAREKKNRKQQ